LEKFLYVSTSSFWDNLSNVPRLMDNVTKLTIDPEYKILSKSIYLPVVLTVTLFQLNTCLIQSAIIVSFFGSYIRSNYDMEVCIERDAYCWRNAQLNYPKDLRSADLNTQHKELAGHLLKLIVMYSKVKMRSGYCER
jgi:hypothetical protein